MFNSVNIVVCLVFTSFLVMYLTFYFFVKKQKKTFAGLHNQVVAF